MSEHVSISFDKLTEACDYYGYDLHVLEEKFPSIKRASKEHPAQLTFKQIETIAKLTGYPLGYFFLSSSPKKDTLIPDLRTPNSETRLKLSRSLQQQIEFCMNRVEWYREYAISEEFEKVECVNSIDAKTKPEEIAHIFSRKLHIKNILTECQENKKSVNTYFRRLRDTIEDFGVLTEASGIAGNNTHAVLSTNEFRGFAITDDYAPLIFVNKKDATEAQIFTLLHEFAHILRGESGISDSNVDSESWCNRFAAEILVPSSDLTSDITCLSDIEHLARQYYVSRQVILFRAKTLGLITKDLFSKYWKEVNQVDIQTTKRKGGGDAIKNLSDRLSKRFTYAVIGSAQSGKTLFTDAFRLLGANGSTFWKLADRMEHNI